MKLKSNKIKIYKNLYFKKKYIKNEIKKVILKSIIINSNIKPLNRANALYKLSSIKNKFNISKQKNNICLKTGRIKGCMNDLKLSRHFVKILINENNLQNIKINTW